MKSWTYYLKHNRMVTVQQLPDGRWMGSAGLTPQIDTYGTSVKQEVFTDLTDCLKWVGYPVDYVPIPKELA